MTYNADSIEILEGLDHVRKRPGMYIGSTDISGLHHLVWEIVDNSVDEVLMGYCSLIEVIVNKDGSITVSDNGRGIPVDLHPKRKISAARVIFEELNAGGKFNNESYKVAGGLHGVGASVVNALSEWIKIEIYRNGTTYSLEYKKAKPTSKELKISHRKTKKSGTRITFAPDPQIFMSIDFQQDILRSRLREKAYLNPGLRIHFQDVRIDQKEEFCYPQGIKSFVEHLNINKESSYKEVLYIQGAKSCPNDYNVLGLELAIQYNDGYSTCIESYVNSIKTLEGGTHVAGFKSGFAKIINEFAKERNLLLVEGKGKEKKQLPFKADDLLEGASAVLSIKLPSAQFEGQTKSKLGNSEAKGVVQSIVYDGLKAVFIKNEEFVRMIISKANKALQARLASNKAKDIVRKSSKLSTKFTLGKLADCSKLTPIPDRELFIVEGDSAGGSAKQGRDRKTQAILPLKGKPLNVEKTQISKILDNVEMQTIIHTIGTGIGNQFDVNQLQYNKIIIMCDADVDGQHITVLLLTLFYRYMKQLIANGHIYVAMPPLYKILTNKKEEIYAYDDFHLEQIRNNLSKKNMKISSLQRYKGLGEMNPEQLWKTTMDPSRRKIIKIQIKNEQEANQLFQIFMGDDVKTRKEYIENNW